MSVLLVASVGGHLSELVALANRAGLADGERVWMTWRNPQSESLLAGEKVIWVRDVQPRDLGAVLSVARQCPKLLRRHKITRVVSTGSALALAVVPVARALGIPCHFIETATRPVEASLTGKLLRFVPGTHLYTQHLGAAGRRWAYRGNIFEGFRSITKPQPLVINKVVVTLGTMDDYGFRRLLEKLLTLLPADAEVLWQTGCTDVTGLPIDARPLVSAADLEAAMRAADVVIGHCGCGTALSAFTAGKLPVLVPREAAYDEHVDDHQQFLADELVRLRLAVGCSVDSLELGHLVAAASSQVERSESVPTFQLIEGAARREQRLGSLRRSRSVAGPGLPAAPQPSELEIHAEAGRESVGPEHVIDLTTGEHATVSQ
jgi:UDP-N-acetylglucosamine transferase subunit ALG13